MGLNKTETLCGKTSGFAWETRPRLGARGGAILFDAARWAMVVVVLPMISHKMVKENASRPR